MIDVTKQEFLDGLERERERRKQQTSGAPSFTENVYADYKREQQSKYLMGVKRRMYCHY